MSLRPCLTCGALSTGSYCQRHKPNRQSRFRGTGQAAFRKRTLRATGGHCAVPGCATHSTVWWYITPTRAWLAARTSRRVWRSATDTTRRPTGGYAGYTP
jgi:hypothetical protein